MVSFDISLRAYGMVTSLRLSVVGSVKLNYTSNTFNLRFIHQSFFPL